MGIGADLPFAIEEQVPRRSAALGGQAEGDEADRAGRGNWNDGHGGVASRTRPPRPDALGQPAERLPNTPPATNAMP